MVHNNNEITTIDIFKFISAFFVVSIHVSPFKNIPIFHEGFWVIQRCAVPYFFITSGYFFFIHYKDSYLKYLKKYIVRILILYIFWGGIYFPFLVKRFYVLEKHSILQIVKLIVLDGGGGHLWYLPASILAVLLTIVCYKIIGKIRTIFISLLLLIIGTIYSTYRPIMDELNLSPGLLDVFVSNIGFRNGLFGGFFYIAFGGIIAFKHDYNLFSSYYILIILGILLILSPLEGILVSNHFYVNDKDFWLMAIPISTSLFICSLNINIKINYNIAVILRNCSTLIYFSHILFYRFLLKVNIINSSGLLSFFLTFLISFIFSYSVILFQKKVKCLKYIY